jgi:hypothetical protein
MSLTKKWIESETESGVDVLNQTLDNIDIELEEYYCFYSGLPSIKAYESK